jgi:hypothetical protein
MKFTKSTKIINIGHLPAHTNGKVDILQANGFTDVSALLCESTPLEEVKRILNISPNSLFLVGGAMMQGFPDLMAELLDYIDKECPTIKVHKTVKADFEGQISPNGRGGQQECFKYLLALIAARGYRLDPLSEWLI